MTPVHFIPAHVVALVFENLDVNVNHQHYQYEPVSGLHASAGTVSCRTAFASEV